MKERPSLVVIVGLPMRIGSMLYNVAAVLSQEGGVIGIIPKHLFPTKMNFTKRDGLPRQEICIFPQ